MSDEENPSDTIADTTIAEDTNIPAPAIPLRENDGPPALDESFVRGTDSDANVQSEALPAPTPALAQPDTPVSQPPSAQPSEVPTEQTPLMMIPPQVPSQIPQTVSRQGEYTVQLKEMLPQMPNYGGAETLKEARRSMHEMSNLVDKADYNYNFGAPTGRDGNSPYAASSSTRARSKSFSVSADGTVTHRTPLQMSRHELYENIPFTAVFGLQKKERSMTVAVSSYAADLDMLEADQISMATSQKHLSAKELAMRHSQASLMLMDELELDKVMVTTPLIFAVLVATVGQFLVGYNIGVMNAPEKVVFPGHTTAEWSIAVAAFCFGGPFGAYFAGTLAETRGRRGALLICTWTFLLGGLIQTTAPNMLAIIISRLIIGLASGISTVIVPIYLGELAPPTLRGTLGTMTQFAMVVGILMSDFFAFPFATLEKWRMLFSVNLVMAFLQLMCAPWLLESPRWLLSKKPDSRKARYIIKKLRGLRYDHEVDTEVDHFLGAVNVQNVNDYDDEVGDENRNTDMKTIGFIDMLMDEKVRLLVVSSFVLQAVQQLSGINAVFYYSTSFFDGVIANPMIGTTLVGAVNVLATYAALLLMDSFGRRTLILWSCGGMLISCIVIVLSLMGKFSNITALIAVNTYVMFFEIGLGPIPWLIVAEMFDAKYVATAMSASSQINWLFNFFVGLTFPYMDKYLGAFSFLPFAAVLLFGFLFALIWLPETQGTTPEELQAALVTKNSSTVYHNMSFVGDVIGGGEHEQTTLGDEWRNAMDEFVKQEEEEINSGTYNFGFKPIDKIEESAGGTFMGWK